MAEVIHHINGRDYLYEHHREGDKVVSTYLHPVYTNTQQKTDSEIVPDNYERQVKTDSERVPDNYERQVLTCNKCGKEIIVNKNSGNKRNYCLCGGLAEDIIENKYEQKNIIKDCSKRNCVYYIDDKILKTKRCKLHEMINNCNDYLQKVSFDNRTQRY